MRPVDVDGANLFAAGRRIAENFQKESGIPVTFVGGDKPLALPPEIGRRRSCRCCASRCTTCRSTPGATRVAVAMEKVDRALEISVDDNGRGFHFSGTYTLEELELLRLGPASLKRRARSLNAEMTAGIAAGARRGAEVPGTAAVRGPGAGGRGPGLALPAARVCCCLARSAGAGGMRILRLPARGRAGAVGYSL